MRALRAIWQLVRVVAIALVLALVFVVSFGTTSATAGYLGFPYWVRNSATDMAFGFQGTAASQANGVVGIQGGSAGGVATRYANVDLNGIALVNGAGHFGGAASTDTIIDTANGQTLRLRVNGADVATLTGAGALTFAAAAPTIAGGNGTIVLQAAGAASGVQLSAGGNAMFTCIGSTSTCTVPSGQKLAVGGGSAMGKAPWWFYGVAEGAATVANTRDYTVVTVPSTAQGSATITPVGCTWQDHVAGAVGGTCTYELWDNTQSLALCAVSTSCTTAQWGQATCSASGTINAGDVITFRVIAPASDTAGLGTLTCTGYY